MSGYFVTKDRQERGRAVVRRRLLTGIAAGPLLALLPALRAGAASDTLAQPAEGGDVAFMKRAFAMRDLAAVSGDQPYGAAVAKDGMIIGQAPSRVVVDGDPTAHAEMEAIRDAARRQGGKGLSGAVLYSSSPPCPMCEAAAYWAGIGTLVHGRDLTHSGAPRLRRC